MSSIKYITIAIIFIVQAVTIEAKPIFARYYKQKFGYVPSCQSCHKDGGGSPLNSYGQAFKDNGSNIAAFAKIAGMDSDGDGSTNDAEAKAKANPGDKSSTPSKKGSWLDTSSLIPKEVQRAFPSNKTWQLKDAVLTSTDIATAKKNGSKSKCF